MNNNSIVRLSFAGIILALVFSACQGACQRHEKYVVNFERFVERVEENKNTYSTDEWKKNDERFIEFIKNYKTVNQLLSPEDNRDVGHMMGRYFKARLKSLGIVGVIKEARAWFNCLRGFVDEAKALQDIKQGFVDEIKGLIDEYPLLKKLIDELL